MSGIPSASALRHMAKFNEVYDRVYEIALAKRGKTREQARFDPTVQFQAHCEASEAAAIAARNDPLAPEGR